MRKKKAFTLVELLAVIAILGIIALIAIPTVDKALNKGKDQMLETQKAQIIKGAKDYLTVNTGLLPESGASIILTVGQLQDDGFLQLNIKNPKSDDYVSPNAQIEVKAIGTGYKYTVKEDTLNGDTPGGSSDKPTLVLVGGPMQYVELGTPFTDAGYKATSRHGADLTGNVSKTITNKSGNGVSSIETNSINTYIITYTVTDPNDASLSTEAKRTVMVVDTTKPTINLTKGDYLTITAMEVPGFDYTALMTATDNSGSDVRVTFKTNLSQIEGDYYITYTAKDPSGNTATKKITVKVTQGIKFTVSNPGSYTDNKTVIINFPSYSDKKYINQYSLDYGMTWETVPGNVASFTLDRTTSIIARLYYDGESNISATYTVTKFNSDK